MSSGKSDLSSHHPKPALNHQNLSSSSLLLPAALSPNTHNSQTTTRPSRRVPPLMANSNIVEFQDERSSQLQGEQQPDLLQPPSPAKQIRTPPFNTPLLQLQQLGTTVTSRFSPFGSGLH
ncbi:hypothetical protein KY284_011004 [Solanum tuberosum]|nr:hypothetical protein KY284_011004 [Solanum tuberosum]